MNVTKAKVRIYRSVIWLILTYAVETRPGTFKTKQMMAKSNKRTLRTIVGQTRFDHIRNQNIRRQYNVQGIGEWIWRKRDEWN
jgi:hypothetical protein